MTNSELEKALAEIESPEVIVLEEIEHGLNQIYRVDYGGKDSVLKIHTEKKEDNFYHNYEGLLTREMNENNELVPEVYRVSESEDHSFFIMEHLDGISGKNIISELERSQLEKLIETFGRQLRKIHENHSFDRFGYLRKRDNRIEIWKTFDSWKDLLDSHIEIDLESLRGTVFEDCISDLESIYEEEEGSLERNYSPVLIHDDNRFSNLIVDNGELNSIIDWATGYNGTAEFDIIRAEFLLIDHDLHYFPENEKEKLRDCLYRGYGNDFRGTDSWRIHRLASLIYIMKGFPGWKDSYSESERDAVERNLRDKVEELKN